MRVVLAKWIELWQRNHLIPGIMDNILCWNVRGMNASNKQKEVKLLYNKEEIVLIGKLETKLNTEKIYHVTNKLFGG